MTIKKNILEIDKNFVAEKVEHNGMRVYDVGDEPFKIYGVKKRKDGKGYERMQSDIAEKIPNLSINSLYSNTSGGRIRFRTDSSRIILRCILPKVESFPDMPLTGSSCFDLYVDGTYFNVFRPGIDKDGNYADTTMSKDGYESGFYLGERKMRDILIHFPLYNDVSEVFIELEDEAMVASPKEYRYREPVVYYGSSITQGGCASHPGNSYPAIIARRMDIDYINLGFSAGCFSEPEMAEYISGLKMEVLVYDYDHNAGDLQYLEKTHEAFYKRIRQKQPGLPIVIVSAADSSFGN
ncbi:MAG: hypothetical protein J6C37_11275, partial [Roseburia sp.]|nr:hypothetical protein [Roseburia sp.]